MTTFQDGPAKGQTLMLKRTPIVLRVVVDFAGKWDALNNPEDTLQFGEKPYAYVLHEHVGSVHINAGRGRSGFYNQVIYRLMDPQPEHATMLTNAAWTEWCDKVAIDHPQVKEILKKVNQ